MIGASSTPTADPTGSAATAKRLRREERIQAAFEMLITYLVGRGVQLAMQACREHGYATGRAAGWRARSEMHEREQWVADQDAAAGVVDAEVVEDFRCASSGVSSCGQVLRGYRSYPCSEEGPNRQCRDASNWPRLSGHVD